MNSLNKIKVNLNGEIDYFLQTGYEYVDSEWVYVVLDAEDKIICGIKSDGTFSAPGGIEGIEPIAYSKTSLFKISSYNVCQYWLYPGLTTSSDEWIEQFKNFMNGTLNDSIIMFTQEDTNAFIYKNETFDSYDLYKQFYPYYYKNPGLCGIYSVLPLKNMRIISIDVYNDNNEFIYNRKHTYAEINLFGKTVALCSIHGGFAGGEIGLKKEYTKLLEEIGDIDYVIIGGDTNDFYDFRAVKEVFIENGFISANYGYWGDKVTWGEPIAPNPQDYFERKIDTFLVKGFTINSFNVYPHEFKDHYPIVSDIRIL